jgi:hypothetical protein
MGNVGHQVLQMERKAKRPFYSATHCAGLNDPIRAKSIIQETAAAIGWPGAEAAR